MNSESFTRLLLPDTSGPGRNRMVTMLLVALGLLLACLLAVLFLNDFKTRSRMQLAERIPGPKALPVLGNLLDMGFNNDKYHEFMEGLIRKRGTIVRLWVGAYLSVILTEAKYVEVSKLALPVLTH